MEHNKAQEAGELLAMVEWIKPDYIRLTAETHLIGRLASCNLVADQILVSRQHARIDRQGTRYVLTDLASANGTFVNGQRIRAAHLLTSNEIIGLGSATPALRFTDPNETYHVWRALEYDELNMRFTVGHEVLPLTPLQLRLLLHLYRNQGRVCTREECAEAVWGQDYNAGADSGRLDQLVSSVRQVLRKCPQPEQGPTKDLGELIQARRGLGYTLLD